MPPALNGTIYNEDSYSLNNGTEIIFTNFYNGSKHLQIINLLVSFFTRETVRSIGLDKVFVKQSFKNFIFKHGYRCDRLNTKKR